MGSPWGREVFASPDLLYMCAFVGVLVCLSPLGRGPPLEGKAPERSVPKASRGASELPDTPGGGFGVLCLGIPSLLELGIPSKVGSGYLPEIVSFGLSGLSSGFASTVVCHTFSPVQGWSSSAGRGMARQPKPGCDLPGPVRGGPSASPLPPPQPLFSQQDA